MITLTKNEYLPALAPRANTILLLRAGLGTGKSEATIDFMKNVKSSVSIVPRISLTHDILRRIEEKGLDVGHYKNVDDSNKPHQVYCTPSLHKYEGQPELIFIDEVQTIFGGLYLMDKVMDASECSRLLETLTRLAKTAKYVVLADAHMTDTTIEQIKDVFGTEIRFLDAEKPSELVYSHSSSEIEVGLYAESLIRKGKKLFVPCTTLTKTKTLSDLWRGQFPEKNILVLNSATSPNLKKRAMANLTKYTRENNIDILIASPTVSSGVSLDGQWFHETVGFCRAGGVTALEFLQQLGRVRHPIDGRVSFYVDGGGKNKTMVLREIGKEVKATPLYNLAFGEKKTDTDRLADVTFVHNKSQQRALGGDGCRIVEPLLERINSFELGFKFTEDHKKAHTKMSNASKAFSKTVTINEIMGARVIKFDYNFQPTTKEAKLAHMRSLIQYRYGKVTLDTIKDSLTYAGWEQTTRTAYLSLGLDGIKKAVDKSWADMKYITCVSEIPKFQEELYVIWNLLESAHRNPFPGGTNTSARDESGYKNVVKYYKKNKKLLDSLDLKMTKSIPRYITKILKKLGMSQSSKKVRIGDKLVNTYQLDMKSFEKRTDLAEKAIEKLKGKKL